MHVRCEPPIYLRGCPSLPPDLAALAAGDPTPEEEAVISRLVAAIAREIRRRRDAWERQYGPIDLDD